MAQSLDFTSLRRAYAEGAATPVSIAREIVGRCAERGADGVWIAPVAADRLLAAAAALERRATTEDPAAMPLYGLPFAVKDNIDIAGLPTTAACPGYGHVPAATAPVVERLLMAGALLVGKTNLDQFATGLVGTRSPYGVPRNPFDPAYIPGGSSSGSAVAVAAGLAAFALGTDTAGSGRVPAAFNNLVGLKPTRGLVSARGVVPACRSLDCVSVFALTVPDAAAVLEIIRGHDPADGYSRLPPAGYGGVAAMPARFAFGVLRPDQREFFGNAEAAALYEAAIGRLAGLGGEAVEIDFTPFFEAAALVYRGAWLAERTEAVDAALGGRRDLLHPITRRIIDGAAAHSAADAFGDFYRIGEYRQRTAAAWRQVDALLVPTTGTIYRIAEVAADPLGLNETLGRYTNFANLLDLSAVALPNGFQSNGLPVGVTLLAPAFHEPLLAALGDAFQRAAGLRLGATGAALPAHPPRPATARFPYVPVGVVGAHLRGEPLNGELVALGARFRAAARTTRDYRLYALPDGKRPGLVRRPGDGAAIELEIWDVPTAALGAFLAGIAPPLGLGTIALEAAPNGVASVAGFLCEAHAAAGARDITEFGGWRAWRAHRDDSP